MLKKLSKFTVPICVAVCGLVILGSYFYLSQGRSNVSDPQEVAQKAIDYINEKILQGSGTASLVSVTEENNLYKIILKIGETEFSSYATKDGGMLFPEGYALEEGIVSDSEETVVIENKRDVPDIKLFVMSYCPFGLQAQKIFTPVYELLEGKADMGVYFVDYIMHDKQEMDENLTQYCIQKEEKDKYADYLKCFTASGDSGNCRGVADINTAKLQNCVFETDRDFQVTSLFRNEETWLSGQYPQFNVQKELNDQYQVQGSPTIIINDQEVNVSPRTPEKFKKIVCQAFNNPPAECSQPLSEEVPSSGVGVNSGTSDSGSCH
ncbi:MAG: hypothetical protein PHW72_02140 [Candidatus Pacebacteria bacterium]|nr:hypothetical protein [Candidatus Paceibacterota bacterium]